MKPVIAMFTVIGVTMAGCAPSTASTSLDEVTAEITEGRRATEYPEVAVLEPSFADGTSRGACTGTLVAPRVLLTSSQCAVGGTRFQVWVGDQTATGKVTAPVSTGTTFIDLSVVILQTPINLPVYPTLRLTAVAPGTQVVNVGRNDAPGGPSNEIWVSPAYGLSRSTSSATGDYYVGPSRRTPPADKGGAVFIAGTHELVAIIGLPLGLKLPHSAEFSYSERLAPIESSRSAIQRFIDDAAGADVATADCLFNYAEGTYPSVFPSPRPVTQSSDGFVYRFYPSTKMYLGLSAADGFIYTMNLNDPQPQPTKWGPASSSIEAAGCQ